MNNSKRFHSLDFLKFVLAIIIIFHHFQQATHTMFPIINFYGGNISFNHIVECFFMISGFLTAYRLETKPMLSFKYWMIGKFIRIYPVAIFSVIITTFIYCLHRVMIGNFPEHITLGLWQLFNSFTCTFIGGGVGNITLGINNPIWYLCILLICYIFTYVLSWLSDRLKINEKYLYVMMIIIGVSAITYELNLPFINFYTGRGYSAFFGGMLFFYIYKTATKKVLVSYSVICLISCAIAAKIKYGIDFQWGIFTFMIWPSVLIIFLLCEPIFNWSVFSILGAVSFEMYLWHSSGISLYMLVKEIYGQNTYSFIEMINLTMVMIIFSFIMLKIEKKITKKIKLSLFKE